MLQDNDIQRLVTNIFKNTTPKGSQSNDPFWDQAASMLLKALVSFLHYEAPPEEQNFSMVLDLIRQGEVSEEQADLISPLDELFERLEAENAGIVKSGRTHLQDATPIAFSQEISGWRTSLERDVELIELALSPLHELALGGTAVGTGLNAPAEFAERVASELATITGKPFVTAQNKFHALTSKDGVLRFSIRRATAGADASSMRGVISSARRPSRR